MLRIAQERSVVASARCKIEDEASFEPTFRTTSVIAAHITLIVSSQRAIHVQSHPRILKNGGVRAIELEENPLVLVVR